MYQEKKFKFTGVEKVLQHNGETILKQIVALQDIPRYGVKTGDLGGFLEHEDCLCHFGDAWVAKDGMVLNTSMVSGDSLVTDSALLKSNCYLYGTVVVSGKARVNTSNIQGDVICIGEDAVVEGCTINGFDIHIAEQCHLANIEIQAPSKHLFIGGNAHISADYVNKRTKMKGMNISIKGNAQLLNVNNVFGNEVLIQGYAVLDSAEINGDNIRIEDATTVKCHVTIESGVSLSDCVTLTSMFGSSVSNIHLTGDRIYTTETLVGA